MAKIKATTITVNGPEVRVDGYVQKAIQNAVGRRRPIMESEPLTGHEPDIKVGEIAKLIGEIEAHLDALEHNLSRLFTDIMPILRDTDPVAREETKSASFTDLGSHLSGILARVHYASLCVNDLSNRVEL